MKIHRRFRISSTLWLMPIAAAVGCVGLMLRAGRRNESYVLRAMFAVWVASPFVVLALAIAKTKNRMTCAAVYGVTLLLVVGCGAIYWNVSGAPAKSSVAFPFLVTPGGSWVLIGTVIPAAAMVTSRRLTRVRVIRWVIKTITLGGASVVSGVIVLLGLLLMDHNRDTVLPAPTGAYAVGRATFDWSDTQIDPLGPGGTRRELIVWMWYPATRGARAETYEDYLPDSWRKAFDRQTGVLFTQFLNRDLARVYSHSVCGAEVSSTQRSYPVVFMRGGGAAPVTDYTTLAEDLASHGYVVVGFDVPYRTGMVVRQDGTAVARLPQNNLDLVDGREADELAAKLAEAWTADTGFALDQIAKLNASDASGRFVGRLDLQHVGIFGHSLGGATALEFCHDEPRCKAGIDVDGAPVGKVVADGVGKPFMFIVGDHSGEHVDANDPETIRDAMANMRSIYDRLPSDRRMEITISGANHYMFSDGVMLKSPLVMGVLRMIGVVPLDGRQQIAITAHYVNTFFDVYLKGAPISELRGNPVYPEVETERW